MKKKFYPALCCLLLITLAVRSQRPDTTRVYSLPEVMVNDPYRTREVRSATPLQILSNEQLRSLQALQVSDAVKHFAGVTVKDYGGIGGLKTVSIRSLGAQHTAVAYDGILVSDCQTGQVDLGRFSLNNVDRLSLSNGQSDQIFQPARSFASAGLLNIQTLTPHFEAGRSTNLSAAFKTGSWGLVNPSVLLEQRVGQKWSLSANAEWMSWDGHYPYTLRYNAAADAQESREKRRNTDVDNLRAELSAFARFSDSEQWRLKAYYYQSSRGLPNATTYYYDFARQHLIDRNVFLQSGYKKEFGSRWAFQTSAKWNWSGQNYHDPDVHTSTGITDNSYYQQEYYLSAAALYRAFHKLSFSLSTDGAVNTLHANLPRFAAPVRYSWLSALAGKYVSERFTASGSLLATVVDEQVKTGGSAGNHRRLSPAVSLAAKPLADEELRVRFFYKDIFRLPSFNDLYYDGTGNIRLRPERAVQYNVGITYSKELSDFVPYLSATVDAYYNKVSDKIVAIPTKNLFVWSMVNLGKVDIKGVDATAAVTLCPAEKWRVRLSGNYTYQQALDVTNPDPATSEGKVYRHQIAYTPRVSGSGQARIETPWLHFSYAFLFSGKRYALGQNIPDNRLDGYSDHSLSVGKDIRLWRMNASLNVEVLNLLNKNYEIVKNFPMPGRSIRLTFRMKN